MKKLQLIILFLSALLFISTTELLCQPLKEMQVTQVTDDLIRMENGKAHGIEPGAIYQIKRYISGRLTLIGYAKIISLAEK